MIEELEKKWLKLDAEILMLQRERHTVKMEIDRIRINEWIEREFWKRFLHFCQTG